MRRLVPFIFPVIVVVAVTVLVFARPDLPSTWLGFPYLRFVPHVLLVLAGVLGWRFGQLKLALLAAVLTTALHGAGSQDGSGLAVARLAALVLPVCTVLLAVCPERGLLTAWGVVRVLAVVATVVALAALPGVAYAAVDSVLPSGLLAPLMGECSTFPRLGGGVTFAALVVLCVPRSTAGPVSGALLAASLVAACLGLCALSPHFPAWAGQWRELQRVAMGVAGLHLYFATAGVLLIYTVLELSYGSAFIYPLTRVPNRRAMEARLATLGSTYTIAMVDVDHFKRVNDRHGHDTGDQALRFIATRLRGVGVGRVYRYGGEEFAIVVPRRRKEQVIPFLEAVREDVCGTPFYIRSQARPSRKPKGQKDDGKPAAVPRRRIPLSVSVGVAACHRDKCSTEDIIAAADKALYRAKKKGRNRVEVAR